MTINSIEHSVMNEVDSERLTEVRRHLHSIPELRFEEVETSEYLISLIEPIADRLITGVGGTGLIATIDGLSEGPHVLLRADMDAYPVTEVSDSAYVSTTPGVTHACGHDVHMTIMYGVLARLASERPSQGRVSVLFQPAEEIPFGQKSGARAVLESEFLENSYDAVLGLHCWPQLEAGVIGVDERISMAAKDAFQIEISGVGAHAATPANGRDAVLAMCQLVSNLHGTLSRRRNPDEMMAFNVGTIVGGASQSLVAPSCVATGTLRTHDEAVQKRMKLTIEQMCNGLATQENLAVNLLWSDAMPSVLNAPSLVELAMSALDGIAVVSKLRTPPLTSDDFALLTALGPSLYLKLGVGKIGAGESSPLHSPTFHVDESCLSTGVQTMERLTRLALSSNNGKW